MRTLFDVILQLHLYGSVFHCIHWYCIHVLIMDVVWNLFTQITQYLEQVWRSGAYLPGYLVCYALHRCASNSAWKLPASSHLTSGHSIYPWYLMYSLTGIGHLYFSYWLPTMNAGETRKPLTSVKRHCCVHSVRAPVAECIWKNFRTYCASHLVCALPVALHLCASPST